MRWWIPLLVVPLGLLAILGLASMAGFDVGAGLQRLVDRVDSTFSQSSLRMDDGTHSLYVAWDSQGVQEAAIDDCPISPAAVLLQGDIVTVIGAVDGEGFPIWQDTPIGSDAELRVLPGDPLLRLGLRLAGEPNADGGLRVRAEQVYRHGTVEPVDGPALQAGVQPGDVLLAVEGTRPATGEQLREALRARQGDEALALVGRRDGAEQDVVLHPLALTGQNFWQFEMQEQERAHSNGEQVAEGAGSR